MDHARQWNAQPGEEAELREELPELLDFFMLEAIVCVWCRLEIGAIWLTMAALRAGVEHLPGTLLVGLVRPPVALRRNR